MKRPRLAVAVLAALMLCLALPSAASATSQGVDDFDFESFDADYTLDLDGEGRATMRVVETIVALFPPDQNRGIVRAIPLNDGEVPLDLQVVSVTDENGAPWYYERDDYDGFAELALGTDEFLEGRTTFVIEYTMRDTIRYFGDENLDEFYWDVNGTGWGQTFGTVSAHVSLGPALAAALTGDSACYEGYYGETGLCELVRSGDSFEVSTGPVYPYSTVTIAIGLAPGTVEQPALPRDSWIVQVAPKLLLGVMVLLLVLSALLRTVVWRDAPGRGTVIAQYTPPEGSDLLLDANVVARASSGLPALFVDLAVRGIVRVVDNRPGEPDVSERKRFGLRLVSEAEASPRERGVLVTLFGAALRTDKDVRPGALNADKGASLYGLTSSTATAAVTMGLRATPESRWRKVIVRTSLVTILLLVAVAVWAIVFGVLDGSVLWPGVIAVVLALAIPEVLSPPARLTRAGADLRDHLLGLKLYLTVAEEERLRMLQSPEGALRVDVTDEAAVVKLNERLLPYAVLWGVEDEWVEKLRAAYSQGTPAWLEGGTLDGATFRSFTTSSTSSVRPIATRYSGGSSSWSSSGGSSSFGGSSGGGFSGGGGGGGGGGGR